MYLRDNRQPVSCHLKQTKGRSVNIVGALSCDYRELALEIGIEQGKVKSETRMYRCFITQTPSATHRIRPEVKAAGIFPVSVIVFLPVTVVMHFTAGVSRATHSDMSKSPKRVNISLSPQNIRFVQGPRGRGV